MSNSFAQHTHRIFQSFEGKRKHAIADQLLNDADALAVLPQELLRGGVICIFFRNALTMQMDPISISS
jgi:hypothetical protein